MNDYIDKISKILRTDRQVVADLEQDLEKITGKVGVMKRIIEENDLLVANRLMWLGLGMNNKAIEIYDALISKIEADDLQILKAVGVLDLHGFAAAKKICDFLVSITPLEKGFFLKLNKARELVKAEPPKKIMAALGYLTVDELLEKEDLLEVFSAIRFLEEEEWQNNIFFKQYNKLTPDDFEERAVQLKPLNEKWAEAAQKFVAKKHHNVSHLKELGIIFIIPVFLGISGETLRLIALLFHYRHEINYYSDLFKKFAENSEKKFASHVISLLRGDVLERRAAIPILEARRPRWLIVQRYLAKNDENDWRLFEPHINPEALHWQRAEDDMVKIQTLIKGFEDGLDFWKGLGWVGDFFKTDTGVPVLVSFNIVDTIMALVKEQELVKYLYHQQEAMWNKIFISYFSLEELEEYSKRHIIQGWFEA